MTGDDRPDPALERLFEEAHRTVEKQLRVGESVDAKAAEILRFDAIVLGVVMTGASLTLRSGLLSTTPAWIVGLFALGFVLLVASTLFAVRCYRLAESRLGVQPDDLVRARVEGATEEEVLDAGLRGYAEGIRRNARSIDAAARRLRAALRTLWFGLATLAAATTILMILGLG